MNEELSVVRDLLDGKHGEVQLFRSKNSNGLIPRLRIYTGRDKAQALLIRDVLGVGVMNSGVAYLNWKGAKYFWEARGLHDVKTVLSRLLPLTEKAEEAERVMRYIIWRLDQPRPTPGNPLPPWPEIEAMRRALPSDHPMQDGWPVLYARDADYCYVVYCLYCAATHSHTRMEGHRVAHCHNPDSPYRKTGYIIKLPGNEALGRWAPPTNL